MRLKSKYITLAALIVLTATPRAFDQLADLKNFAAEKFRVELLSIFWNFTTPESRRGSARENSELLARMQTSAPTCNSTDENKTTRRRLMNGDVSRSTTIAIDLGHPQWPIASVSSPENFVADNATLADEDERLPDAREGASRNNPEKIALSAREFVDYPGFDEFTVPVRVDDAVAQFEWSQEAEAAAPPDNKPPLPAQKGLSAEQRFAWKIVKTQLQNRLPKNLNLKLNGVVVNTGALIKAHDSFAPTKPKYRIRVLPVAPEAPRPLDKPAVIS